MAAAIAISGRGCGRTGPNPNVGCVIVRAGQVVGRGWTQPGGRPHAEAMALAEAGSAAAESTLYTTLEPCAHDSVRGPTCSALIVAAGVARVVIGLRDPDPRTNGAGAGVLHASGLDVVEEIGSAGAARSMAGFLTRMKFGRPHVTLKLAVSLDGCIARMDGDSRWITGPLARAHGHVERVRAEAILVGRGTWEADAPRLDVRLPGLDDRSPMRLLLTSGVAPDGWAAISSPDGIATLAINHLLVEGGASAASSFLRADLVDRLLIYTAPILIGGGKSAIGDIGLASLSEAHDRWRLADTRMLGPDRLDIYRRVRD